MDKEYGFTLTNKDLTGTKFQEVEFVIALRTADRGIGLKQARGVWNFLLKNPGVPFVVRYGESDFSEPRKILKRELEELSESLKFYGIEVEAI